MAATLRSQDTRLISTAEAAALAGVTYRQADYWLRCGHVHTVDSTEGTGNPRQWDDDGIAVLRVLGLVSAALGRPQGGVLSIAAEATRELIRSGWLGDPLQLDLSPTVQLVVETAP